MKNFVKKVLFTVTIGIQGFRLDSLITPKIKYDAI